MHGSSNSRRKTLKIKGASGAHSSTFPSLVELPETVIAEILIRLPCKSCFRFKSVCKRWLHLMSESYFISQFFGHHKQIVQFSSGNSNYKQACTVVSESGDIIVSVDDPVFKPSGRFSLSFLPCYEADQNPPIHIVASCNDLLLCCPTSEYHEVYYICNPLTKRWLKLPESTHRRSCIIKIGFLADPMTNNSILAGFNYKVLRFLESQEKDSTDGLLLVEIYSSETREWSQVSALYPPGHTWDPRRKPRAAFANCGMLYWGSLSPTNNDLIVYDVFSNQFFLMEGPNDVNDPPFGTMCRIGSCKGRIRISYRLMWPELTLRIWELEDYHDVKRWRLVNMVNIKEVVTNDDKLDEQVKSIGWLIDWRTFIHPHDEDLVYLIFNRRVALCNMRRMTLTPISQCRGFCVQDLLPLQFQFWPTPLPIR